MDIFFLGHNEKTIISCLRRVLKKKIHYELSKRTKTSLIFWNKVKFMNVATQYDETFV